MINSSFLANLNNAIQLGGADFQRRQDEDLYNKAFAVNPALAGEYQANQLAMKQQQFLEDEQRRAMMQQRNTQSALEQLYQNPNATPQQALGQLSAVTGDPSYLGNFYKSQLDQGLQDPAAVRTTQFYLNATPEERAAFERVNKIGTDRVDAGDRILITDKQTGAVVAEIPKELAPGERPETKEDQAAAAERGKVLGQAQAEYDDLVSAYPQLIDVSNRLRSLGRVATYTGAGRFSDAVKRELGTDVGTPAEAAAEMATIIDVEVLPLLRPTFGAAFTVNEGEWLRNTMGNPNLSPQEKVKQINARVRGWNNRIKTLETRINVPKGQRLDLVNPSQQQDPLEGKTATGANGQKIIRRGGQWVPLQ